MSKKWKALHKREFEEKMDPEFLEPDKQLPLIENKRRREKMEYWVQGLKFNSKHNNELEIFLGGLVKVI